jgi:HSP20 family protein
MQREINRMFDGFFRGSVREDDAIQASAWMPAADVAEHEDTYEVRMEIPGVAKEDVRITIQENILTVRGEKKKEKETRGSRYHAVERSYGSFQRSFTLPSTVNADAIEAEYRDGILQMSLPKAEEARQKQIEVKVR